MFHYFRFKMKLWHEKTSKESRESVRFTLNSHVLTKKYRYYNYGY